MKPAPPKTIVEAPRRAPAGQPYHPPHLRKLGTLGRVVKQSGTVTVTGGRT
jgi:hypothetical protein